MGATPTTPRPSSIKKITRLSFRTIGETRPRTTIIAGIRARTTTVGMWPRTTVNDRGAVINKIARGRISRTDRERISKTGQAPARIRVVPEVEINPRGTHRADMDNSRIEARAIVLLVITAPVATRVRTVPADSKVFKGIALSRQAGGIAPRRAVEAQIAAVVEAEAAVVGIAVAVVAHGTGRLVWSQRCSVCS